MGKNNGNLAKWIIVALAVAGLIFNSGVLYNHVKSNSKCIEKIESEIRDIRLFLLEKD